MQLIARHELWCYASSQLHWFDCSTSNCPFRLKTTYYQKWSPWEEHFLKRRERCGLSSANQSLSIASHSSCYAYTFHFVPKLIHLPLSYPFRLHRTYIHSTLCLVTSNVMMILLNNNVKAQSIQFEINMHLSSWVTVLLVIGYHLQQWMVLWCIPPLKHWTKMANTHKKNAR